jgi:dsRNA-specific ribonuclease
MQKLEQAIGYTFRDRTLLEQALSHSSYANEHSKTGAQDNERLEFLGDAVLELVSSRFLYLAYPDLPEGDLTKLRASIVCEPTLALCARQIVLPLATSNAPATRALSRRIKAIGLPVTVIFAPFATVTGSYMLIIAWLSTAMERLAFTVTGFRKCG